jgi:hypothetical protein
LTYKPSQNPSFQAPGAKLFFDTVRNVNGKPGEFEPNQVVDVPGLRSIAQIVGIDAGGSARLNILANYEFVFVFVFFILLSFFQMSFLIAFDAFLCLFANFWWHFRELCLFFCDRPWNKPSKLSQIEATAQRAPLPPPFPFSEVQQQMYHAQPDADTAVIAVLNEQTPDVGSLVFVVFKFCFLLNPQQQWLFQ